MATMRQQGGEKRKGRCRDTERNRSVRKETQIKRDRRDDEIG